MRKKKTKAVRKKHDRGKIRNATRLEVNGLTFRSKLEAFTYKKLLENGITDFKYEEVKFTLLEPFEYNEESFESFSRIDRGTKIKTTGFNPASSKIRGITYLPDFTCINEETKTGWIMEDKGYSNDSFPNKWKTFKNYLVEHGYKVKLYLPNNQGNVLKAIEDIKKNYYNV